MRNGIFILMICLTVLLVFIEKNREIPPLNIKEGCVFCHKKISEPDKSHPISAFGCNSCHLGNPYSFDKQRAHFIMVKKSGDLLYVELTFGKSGCYTDIFKRVKNSIMATNQGILEILQDNWSENNINVPKSVEDLFLNNSRKSLAVDYYAKMCGGCHLWKRRGDFKGETGRRGGGCSNCHVLEREEKK